MGRAGWRDDEQRLAHADAQLPTYLSRHGVVGVDDVQNLGTAEAGDLHGTRDHEARRCRGMWATGADVAGEPSGSCLSAGR